MLAMIIDCEEILVDANGAIQVMLELGEMEAIGKFRFLYEK